MVWLAGKAKPFWPQLLVLVVIFVRLGTAFVLLYGYSPFLAMAAQARLR